MTTREIPGPVLDCLSEKFEILEHLSFLDFDFDFDILKNRLSACYKDAYSLKEKILIEHMDTDYYLPGYSVGINIRNFFSVVREINISYSVFIFYTNHIGIKKEIDFLCRYAHKQDRPLVIESFLSKLHFDPNEVMPEPTNLDKIKHHALCMMNLKRSHRNAVFHKIKHIDQEKLILSATVPTQHDNE